MNRGISGTVIIEPPELLIWNYRHKTFYLGRFDEERVFTHVGIVNNTHL